MEAESFDIVVLGGGKAGKTLAMDQARAGKKVALIERKYLGGSCINVACIPSKTLIASARRFHCTDVGAALARTGRVVSERIAIGTVSVRLAKTRGRTLGRTWRPTMRL